MERQIERAWEVTYREHGRINRVAGIAGSGKLNKVSRKNDVKKCPKG